MVLSKGLRLITLGIVLGTLASIALLPQKEPGLFGPALFHSTLRNMLRTSSWDSKFQPAMGMTVFAGAVSTRIGEGKRPYSRFTSGPAIVLYLALAKLLLHLLTATRYGIFRDEMYYVACSKHLAWGYVGHPPMNVFIAWFARNLFGDSPLGLRLLPAIAGAALVWMTGQLTREMGGGRFWIRRSLQPVAAQMQ
jgi:hypothetical protein